MRMTDAEKLARVVEAIREGGVTAVVITMTVSGALDQISLLHREYGDAIQLGVGSVLSAEVTHQAVVAGECYVVSPVVKPEFFAAAHARGQPAIPGCLFPSVSPATH